MPFVHIHKFVGANLDGDCFLPVSSSRSSFTSSRQLSPFFLDPCFLDFRSMIESVNRSSSLGPKKEWGSTICGALRVPGLSPVVLGLSSPSEHRSAGPRVLPPQRFYEGTKFTVPSRSLSAVPPLCTSLSGIAGSFSGSPSSMLTHHP